MRSSLRAIYVTVCLFHSARARVLWIMHLCMEELAFFKWYSNAYNVAGACMYKAILYECFYQSISWKSMWAVDEKQDIKLLWQL